MSLALLALLEFVIALAVFVLSGASAKLAGTFAFVFAQTALVLS